MTADHLIRQYVDRIRRLKAERADISDAIKDVYAEAKANGLHAKTLRQLVDRIEMEPHLRAEADTLLATYEAALGMDAEEAEAAIAATRPDAAAIALNLLTAEIVGLEDEAHAAMLVDHVLYLLDLRA